MKASRLAILAGGISVVIVLILFIHLRTRRNANTIPPPPNTSGAMTGAAVGISKGNTPLSTTVESKTRSVRPTVAELHNLGFTIIADRLEVSAGEGNVTVRDPNGLKFTGHDFSFSEDGKEIILTGRVSMEMNMGTYIQTNTSKDENAIVRIAVDGGNVSFPGISSIKKVVLTVAEPIE